MNSVRQLQPKKPSYNQLTKAANEIAAKNRKSILSPSKSDLIDKVRQKMDRQFDFYNRNIYWRRIAFLASVFCCLISLSGALLGLWTLIDITSRLSMFGAVVGLGILIALEVGFRCFSDWYFDELILYKNPRNKFLLYFLLCSLATIAISSGGIYKYNMEHHAPDPTLVAAKQDLKKLEGQLALAQTAHTEFVNRNTIKSGRDKGEISYKVKGDVAASKANVDAIQTEVLRLTKLTSGKKTLDADYQAKVLQDSLLFSAILAVFAGLYTLCMYYMSYFDNRNFMETQPHQYLELLAARNEQSINFQ